MKTCGEVVCIPICMYTTGKVRSSSRRIKCQCSDRGVESGRVSMELRILAIPGVQINHIEAPQMTDRGVEIKWIEHKTDFMRLAALREFGGLWLAVWATNYLNNGVLMAVPRRAGVDQGLREGEEVGGGGRPRHEMMGPVVGSTHEIDFASSYVLHAFDSALERILGKGKEIDVLYVLDRQSN
ncbi:uncharacterized protein P884DRAFT_292911 [Thermothelomyces heterothallicus CBS 202.75]|uniref:uncharacterized protein n=1 Tax=Thermothelomyces heterothallicus CBS 202.75 TaxID=1149848 RepID=UPI003744817F